MKKKRMMILTALLLGVLLGREAQAFYNPSTGRWLSRDPINEVAFNALNRNRRSFNREEERTLYGFVRNDPILSIDVLGQCTPGCHRASCVVRVLPAGYSANTNEKVEELAQLYSATEWFGLVVASGQTAAAGLCGLEEAIATAIGEGVGHGLMTPGQAIEHSAKDLINKYGDHNGWTAWIFASYQSCEKRCGVGRLWTGEDGYWKDLAGSRDWEEVTAATPITGGFDDPKAALAAGNKQCKEKTADFRRLNKMCK